MWNINVALALYLNSSFETQSLIYFTIIRYENGFVSGQLGLETTQMAYWIGLSDSDEPGMYKWVDNSPILITNWDDGQPGTLNSSGMGEPLGENITQLYSVMKSSSFSYS